MVNYKLETQFARNLGLFYLFYALNGDRQDFEVAFLRENAGFTDFLDCDDSSADFNFRE